jgi:hypothetical protein
MPMEFRARFACSCLRLSSTAAAVLPSCLQAFTYSDTQRGGTRRAHLLVPRDGPV